MGTTVWDGDTGRDDRDTGQDGDADGFSQLSAYERKRLKNITENAKFFASLKLHESAARLQKIANKVQPHVTKRARPRKAEDEPVRRRSMRLQRAERPAPPRSRGSAAHTGKLPVSFQPQVPPGPVSMLPEDQKENSKVTEEFLAMWTRISEMKPDDAQKHSRDMERYAASLGSMTLHAGDVSKVVKARVCSMAIHPAESAVLVAAGDKLGHVGLWNVVSGFTEQATHVFIPHNYPVSCMHFSPANPAHLVSLSYDSLRCGDVTRAVFDEICRSEESFSSFDFLEENASTLIVGQWDGAVALVDVRTPGTSAELSANIDFKRTRTVHVHPVNKQYFLAAGALIYDTSCLSPTIGALSTVRHNNNTGRWLTRFRAIWDPKQEDCFVVGSMARPRQIEIYQDTGKLLHSFYNVDYLGSVCSINVVHPTRNILVGGNSSGRLHVFKE
ncbi:PREDICTED: WD repeat-containing protein 76 [Tinamus guttatus]|uniref:WD repeat-containing protein 76 n=1 Tax=Tinamus guttatus TaxID=94827 RepID=UPI00052EDA1C|nr:PREDICTED: WD repeat-containing protein 76 [Tinamus guttatus]